jgi:hypothetical protein
MELIGLSDDCLFYISTFLGSNTDLLNFAISCKTLHNTLKHKGFLRFLVANRYTNKYGLDLIDFLTLYDRHYRSLYYIIFRNLPNSFNLLPSYSPKIIIFDNCNFYAKIISESFASSLSDTNKTEILFFYNCTFIETDREKFRYISNGLYSIDDSILKIWKDIFNNLKYIISFQQHSSKYNIYDFKNNKNLKNKNYIGEENDRFNILKTILKQNKNDKIDDNNNLANDLIDLIQRISL